MAVPEVDNKVLAELKSMGFPTVRATRALYVLGGLAASLSGNSSLEDALTWLIEHEHDPNIDQMPLVTNIEIGNGKPALLPEEMKIKAQELQMHARKKKEEEEKRMEREREKERIRAGKEVLEAKRIEEENETKRMIEFRKAEKKEEKRARENILHKLEQDKAERRQKLGLPPDKSVTAKSATRAMQDKKFQSSLSVKHTTKDSMMDCLRSLKKNNKDDDAKVKRAFQTLLIYVGNVFKNPDMEKFRKIRLNNPIFQERVGNLKGGIEFLKLCGFETVEGGKFLFLPRDKVDMGLLNTAGSVLHSAMNNPYFGRL